MAAVAELRLDADFAQAGAFNAFDEHQPPRSPEPAAPRRPADSLEYIAVRR